MQERTVREMFSDFTELFSADGYQFMRMRNLFEDIEAKPHRTAAEEEYLRCFRKIARLCRWFIDSNAPYP